MSRPATVASVSAGDAGKVSSTNTWGIPPTERAWERRGARCLLVRLSPASGKGSHEVDDASPGGADPYIARIGVWH